MDNLYKAMAKYALLLLCSSLSLSTLSAQFNRTFDGSHNNPFFPDYGQAGNEMPREGNATSYVNGNQMTDRGANPRMISNLLCAQNEDLPSSHHLSAFVFSFLQFVDHDITLVEGGNEVSPIPVPAGDPFFDPFNTGQMVIPFTRNHAIEGTGTGDDNPRQHRNAITSWLDASMVYGSDDLRATWLRTGIHGKLKTSPSVHGDLLPCNTLSGDCNDIIDPNAPFMDHNRDRCGELVKTFVAGDVRANEQPTLLALHTLFVREHNRICDELVASGKTNDEENYQYARKIVSGLIQSILYQEALPALGLNLGVNSRYNVYSRPDILNEFATAAFRLGHTMITTQLDFADENGNPVQLLSGCGAGTEGVFGGTDCQITCGSENLATPLALRDAFFNPSLIANNGFEQLFRGIAKQYQQEIDLKIVDDVRNFLFGQPGSGGLDLAATNIQRGRDHGLPDYNSLRQMYGMQAYSSFGQISNNAKVVSALESAYGSINNIDPWIGMLAEDHLPGASIGATLHTLLTHQFKLLRDCDRYWFDRDHRIPFSVRREIKNTTLSDVIKRNTFTLFDLSDDVFHVEEETDEPVASCNMLSNPDFSTSLDNWTFFADSRIDARASMDGGGCFIDIENTNNRYADVRLEQNIPLERGKTYLLTFKAKSNGAKVLLMRIMRENNTFIPLWQTSAVVRNSWKTYGPYVIRATADQNQAPLQFCLGIRNTDVWLDDIEFKEVGCEDVDGRAEQAFALQTFKTNESAYLSWLDTQQEQVVSYDVLRSQDGENWDKIASLPPNADNSFVDESPAKGSNFYKIRAVDRQYLESYTNIGYVQFHAINSLSIYPNPVVDYFEIAYDNGLNGQSARIEVVDIKGTILYSAVELLDGFPIPVQLSNSVNGALFVKIKPEGQPAITRQIGVVRP
jgi:peroxidase